MRHGNKTNDPVIVYVIQTVIFIAFLFMSIIEFFWLAMVITDSDPIPTTGEYFTFMVWVIFKFLLICLPLTLQRWHIFTMIISVILFCLNSFWVYMLVIGTYGHVVFKAPTLLIVSDLLSLICNSTILAISAWIIMIHVKKRLTKISGLVISAAHRKK